MHANVVSDSFGSTITKVESTFFPFELLCIHLSWNIRRVSNILDKKQL